MNVARVAVVGCGYWGRNLVRTFHEHGALVAVCDDNEDLAAQFAAQFDVGVASFDEVLANADVDGVAIAAPAAQHAMLAKRALNAGKHVFVEKPLALDVRD